MCALGMAGLWGFSAQLGEAVPVGAANYNFGDIWLWVGVHFEESPINEKMV